MHCNCLSSLFFSAGKAVPSIFGFSGCREQGCAVALPSICAGNGNILIAVEALPGWVYALIWFWDASHAVIDLH
jgi:hypothetical protein